MLRQNSSGKKQQQQKPSRENYNLLLKSFY